MYQKNIHKTRQQAGGLCRTRLHTYIRTYVRTYVRTYIHTYISLIYIYIYYLFFLCAKRIIFWHLYFLLGPSSPLWTCVPIHLSAYLYIYISIYNLYTCNLTLFVYINISIFPCVSIFLSTYLSTWPINPPTNLLTISGFTVSWSFYLLVSFCLSILLSLSVYLSTFLSSFISTYLSSYQSIFIS